MFQNLKVVLFGSSIVLSLALLWFLWPILPVIATVAVVVAVGCLSVFSVRIVSTQIAAVVGQWLDIADKRLSLAERKQSMWLQTLDSQVVAVPSTHVIAMRTMTGLDFQYIPIEQQPRALLPSPDATKLLSHASDGQICLGVGDGGAVIEELDKVRGVLVLGLGGGGKTNTAIWLIAQVLAQGGRFLLIDKHARAKKDSLYSQVKPWAKAALGPCGVDGKSALKVVSDARKILNARLAGGSCDYPFLLIIDEFTAIMRQLKSDGEWSPVAESLVALVGDFNSEGRKVGCFAICIGQASNADKVGGSDVRDTFCTRVVHRMQEKQASMLSMTDEKGLISKLKQGECLVDIDGNDAFQVRVPYVDGSLVESVAGRLSAVA